MKKIIIGIVLTTMLCTTINKVAAQAYRDDWTNYHVIAGYQQLIHQGNSYNVATLQAEVIYSYFGSRIGVTYGPDYLSFSPCGIIMFSVSAFRDAWLSMDSDPFLALFEMATLIGAMQFKIPLSDYIEITTGWDAMKFTRMDSSPLYVTGSLNAGLSVYLGEHLFLNGYYEFNHTHNPIISLMNYMELSMNSQPGWLRGHSWGVRLGWQF